MAHDAQVALPFTIRLYTIACRWKWSVSKDGVECFSSEFQPDFDMTKSPPEPRRVRLPADPWVVRKEFLGLPRNNAALLSFLDRVGNWPGSESASANDFWRWQDLIRRLLTTKPSHWSRISAPPTEWFRRGVRELTDADNLQQQVAELIVATQFGDPYLGLWDSIKANPMAIANNLDAKVTWAQGLPHLEITTDNALAALLATVFVDAFQGKRYGICARPDCRNLFEFTSKHRRKYHDSYCGHLESLRRKRGTKGRKPKEKNDAAR
jgi:hypothetical protein